MKRALACVALATLASCVPWTTRPIGETETGPFDAAKYVNSIWASKVVPAASRGMDLAQFLAARPSSPAMVKGEARVLRVDTSSLTGLMFIDLAPYDGRADAAIQIGPVIQGTALRDALPFIQFSQFTNQLEFARVANALNDRVIKNVVSEAPKQIVGKMVSFTGAASAGTPVEIVPVTLVFHP